VKLAKLFKIGVVAAAVGLAGCSDGGTVVVTPTGAVQDNFFVTWEIRSVSFGPLDCAEAGAAFVDMDLVNVDTGERQVFSFDCFAYEGTSGMVGVGSFDVLLNLADARGGVIAQANVGVQNVTVSGTIDLGHTVFQVP
jgi:hypothetical protein